MTRYHEGAQKGDGESRVYGVLQVPRGFWRERLETGRREVTEASQRSSMIEGAAPPIWRKFATARRRRIVPAWETYLPVSTANASRRTCRGRNRATPSRPSHQTHRTRPKVNPDYSTHPPARLRPRSAPSLVLPPHHSVLTERASVNPKADPPHPADRPCLTKHRPPLLWS